jgi:hypothetical protein
MKILLQLALMLSSALGILWTLCLYGFAYRASQILGHWPIPMINDPKLIRTDDVWFEPLFGIVFLGLFVVLLSLLGVPCALYWYRESISHRVRTISLTLYLMSLILVLTVNFSDPGRCWKWVVD